jgi:hypothetical protein
MFGHILIHLSLVFVSESVDDASHTIDESVHGFLRLLHLLRKGRGLIYLVEESPGTELQVLAVGFLT